MSSDDAVEDGAKTQKLMRQHPAISSATYILNIRKTRRR